MGNKLKKRKLRVSPYLWRITAITVACTILYYLPIVAGLFGGTSVRLMLAEFHNFYGIDFYVLPFFAPVVYTAYVLGINWVILIAFVSTLIILPYAILIDPFPNVLFKPAAFAIILSAVGAVVAMLQRNDEQRRRSVTELKCLYDIGKAAEESGSIEGFLSTVIALIPKAMQYPGETMVRMTVRDTVFQSPDFAESAYRIQEDLIAGGETLGSIEIFYTRNGVRLKTPYLFIKTLAERISGAVRGIELEQSLRIYYEQLEEMVEKRTRDLEQVQGKLIRSERLAAVGELASGVGHELRNPLNVIRNCAYLLHMGLDEEEEEAKNTLAVLDKQVDIANRIVTDLLDFTRIKSPSLTEVNLNSLVKESLSWVVVPKGVNVIANLGGKAPHAMADSEQIGRAFANIISNAVQAMNGKGELRIKTVAKDGLALVTFEDCGCGISEENLSQIFEPLFTTKPKGIGLGLAITKRLVEQNHGVIEVTSQLAKGTTFTIRLPLAERKVNVA